VGVLAVRHLTTYHFAKPVGAKPVGSKPVRPGEHRMMVRPCESHDLRLIRTRLSITPASACLGMQVAASVTREPSHADTLARPDRPASPNTLV
jgi:hypothetical protein